MIFWDNIYNILKKKEYTHGMITSVDKMSTLCMAAIGLEGIKLEKSIDNLIMRIKVNNT